MENRLSKNPIANGPAFPVEHPGPWPVSFDIPLPAKTTKTAKKRTTRAAPAGKPQSDTFTVYVDGSSLGNPGPSGFAALIIWPDGKRQTIADGLPHSTNNRMELQATIATLEVLPEDAQGVIRSDAQYVVYGANVWREKWELNGFRNASKKEVENLDLWRTLFKLRDARPGITFEWVRGHGTDATNSYVDHIARAEAAKQEQALLGAVKDQKAA